MADIPVGEPSALGRFYQKVVTRSGSIYQNYTATEIHRRGMERIAEDFVIGKRAKEKALEAGIGGTIGKFITRGYLAYSVYSGYKEGGIVGAAKGAAENLAWSYGFGAAAPILLGAGVIAGGAAVGVLGGIGFASMSEGVTPLQLLTRRRVREHQRRHANIEMGAPVNDPHGNLATMRQRSLAAMQNSRLSGMNALGYEAQISYSRYQVRR